MMCIHCWIYIVKLTWPSRLVSRTSICTGDEPWMMHFFFFLYGDVSCMTLTVLCDYANTNSTLESSCHYYIFGKKLWLSKHLVVVFSHILDLVMSCRPQNLCFIVLEKEIASNPFFLCTLTLCWKLGEAVLKLQPIKNTKTGDHHICANPKLTSGSTRKVLLVSMLLSILPSARCENISLRQAQLSRQYIFCGFSGKLHSKLNLKWKKETILAKNFVRY